MSATETLVRRIKHLERRLEELETLDQAYGFVPLTTPYTNTSFDGDSFSDVGTNTKIENTSWSTTIPANAVALLLRVRLRDSGATASPEQNFNLYNASGATVPAINARVMPVDDIPNDVTSICPCTSGDIWYQCNASGASTLEVWLWCLGYWI